MYLAVTFSSQIIRDLAPLVKSCVYVFDSYWFILTFYLKEGHKKMVCNRAFSYKKINFVREFLISQSKKFHQIAPF